VSAVVPEVGDSVELVVGADVSVRADVREQLGYAVWLAVPPVLDAGRRLALRWQAGDRTVTTTAHVMRSTTRQGLCLAIGTAGLQNRRRRGVTRHAPREPLRALLSEAGGGRVTGSVVDLSFGGCCVAIAGDGPVIGARLTIGFLRPARTGDVPLLEGLVGRVTGIGDAPDGGLHVHIAFESAGVAAVRIAALLGAAKADRPAAA
jgi:hypothetical protein